MIVDLLDVVGKSLYFYVVKGTNDGKISCTESVLFTIFDAFDALKILCSLIDQFREIH